MNTFRQVIFWIGLIISIASMLWTGSTWIQLTPFAIFLFLAGSMIWKKKDFRIGILVLSAIMAILNISISSTADILFWIAAFLAFI